MSGVLVGQLGSLGLAVGVRGAALGLQVVGHVRHRGDDLDGTHQGGALSQQPDLVREDDRGEESDDESRNEYEDGGGVKVS